MARMWNLLCVCLCFHYVNSQFGFFPQEQRRFASPFDFAKNFIPARDRIRNTLTNILHLQPQNPSSNPDYIYPFPNRPVVNNQNDQNIPQYPNNRPNHVRFPNQNSQEPDIPNDNVYTEQPIPIPNSNTNNEDQANNADIAERPVDAPKEDSNGDNYDTANSGVATQAPDVVNNGNEGTLISGSQDGPAFGTNNAAATEEPSFGNKFNNDGPAFTTLPTLTPVPNTEKRNNFNFGTAGIFKETCQTVDNEIGSCLNIRECEPYVKLLQQARTNSAVVQVLRRAQCGFEGNSPKVCCPRPGIPAESPTSPAPVPTQEQTAATSAPTEVASPKTINSDYIAEFLSPPECGYSKAFFGRVVGGVNASLGWFPWMALLGYKGKRTPATGWRCGGSLISRHHVLTAAHCIHNYEEDLYVVRVGELDLAREDEGATPIDVLIKNKIKHENYNPQAFTNDIGLLILQNDVTFTNLIRPICIPTSNKLRSTDFTDYMPFIAGWGDLEFRGPKATLLQVLQLPVVSKEFCQQAYKAYKAQVIDDRVLCAGFKKGGKDSCQGDSGGPLMQPIYNPENGTTYFYQIGVVSFGKKCAEPGFPGVYTKVASFVPWLQKHVLGFE